MNLPAVGPYISVIVWGIIGVIAAAGGVIGAIIALRLTRSKDAS